MMKTNSVSSTPDARPASAPPFYPPQTRPNSQDGPVSPVSRPAGTGQAGNVPTPKTPAAQPGVALRFRVDEGSGDLHVYIIDKQAHRVLRTIPSQEMQTLSPGELVRLAA